jgi:hypothetical protein
LLAALSLAVAEAEEDGSSGSAFLVLFITRLLFSYFFLAQVTNYKHEFHLQCILEW